MTPAIVTVTSPLTVRLKGDLTDTLVQRKGSHVPALSVNDPVLVELVDRRAVVVMKLVVA